MTLVFGNYSMHYSLTLNSVHIVIKEKIALSLLRDGGVSSMELKGDMNLHVSDPDLAQVQITLAPPQTEFGGRDLQFKQHPKVARFGSNVQQRVVKLKEASMSYPVGQSLAVLRWRYQGTDESNVPLSSTFTQFCCVLVYSRDGSQLLAKSFQ